MKTRDLNIILCLLAIGILIAGYYLLYRPEKDKEARLTSEINELQARYDDLKAKEAHRDEYVAETAELKKQFEEELTKYPADLNQETTIMFLKGTEEKYDTWKNVSVGLPKETVFYTLGKAPETADVAVGEEGAASGSEPYVCTTAQYPIVFKGSYDQLQEYVDYIAAYKYRMNISSITMSYNEEEEELNGTIALNGYAVSGPDRVPDEPTLNQPTGEDNLFLGGEGAPVSDSSKYSEDDGAAIVSSHNLVMLLNNAKNDTASGVIVASSENDEKTYVTSESNDVADVTIEIYSTDDKNFIKYSIGSKNYETEVLTDDVTIYVKSSERVDSDDKNGVNVKISNTSVLPVYIKVADDDSSSPRFKLGEKSGTVKVY